MAIENYVYSEKKKVFYYLSQHIKILLVAMIMIEQLNVSINH